MNRSTNRRAFSLVEVTLALGVAAFCLVAIYGLLPVGMASQRAAISQATAAQIFSVVYSDLQRNQKGSPSALFGVTDGTDKTMFFDAAGNLTTNIDDRIFRLTISFPNYSPNARSATAAHLLLTSPGFADPAQATGKYQLLAAFDRN